MQSRFVPALVLVILVGVATAPLGQDAEKAGLEAEVQALSAEVAELTSRLEEAERRVDQAVEYLERSQKAAAEMTKTLAASEEAGFTFGINPKSRELLLEGWRKQLSELQKGVPASGATDEVAPPSRRGPGN